MFKLAPFVSVFFGLAAFASIPFGDTLQILAAARSSSRRSRSTWASSTSWA